MIFFNKSGSIVIPLSPDSSHELVYQYKEGDLYKKFSINSGVINGKEYTYYSDGKLFSIKEFKSGVLLGDEVRYYPNGVKYSAINWINGVKRDSLTFDPQGKINDYFACSIYGEPYFAILYNYEKDSYNHDGLITYHMLYSKDIKTNKLIELQPYGKFNNIRDLYIYVINPPRYNLKVSFSINKKVITNYQMKDKNTLIFLPNAFPTSGFYNLKMSAYLYNEHGVKVDSMFNGGTYENSLD